MTASEPAPLPVTPAGVRAPRARFQRSPAVVILLVSALVAIPLVVLSFVDAAGLRSLWDELHWIVSAVGAAIATTVSVQRADGRVRAVRAAGAMAFLLWMIATLLWASRDLLRMGGEPSIAGLFVVAIIGPGVLIIGGSIRGRLSRAEEAAVFLDSGLLVCLLLTVLILLQGSTALSLPAASGILVLAAPMVFIGLGAGGLVALLAVHHPIGRRGAFPLIAGSITIGLAFLGELGQAVGGGGAGVLPGILFTVGTLVAAYGVLTWEDEQNGDPRYVAATRYISRVIGPTTAAITFLALLPQVDPAIELIVDATVFLAGILVVIRQALLLRERTTMLDEVTRLKLENDRLVAELRRELADHAIDQGRLIQSSQAAAVGELAAGVAHEVNNPLAAILGFAELLLVDLDPDDPRRTDVETIRSQALRARSIVRALADFAQRGAPVLAPTDLGDLVRRTVDGVRSQLEVRGVTIEERYDALPEVLVDPGAIQEAIINVLTNATQAVAAKGRIQIAVTGTDTVVTVVVSDDGVGMKDETANRAFEPFFVGPELQPDAGLATGLGLAVSRGLIEAHGGTISLTSRPGQGTRVELRLPVHQPTTADDRGGLGGEGQ